MKSKIKAIAKMVKSGVPLAGLLAGSVALNGCEDHGPFVTAGIAPGSVSMNGGDEIDDNQHMGEPPCEEGDGEQTVREMQEILGNKDREIVRIIPIALAGNPAPDPEARLLEPPPLNMQKVNEAIGALLSPTNRPTSGGLWNTTDSDEVGVEVEL